MLERGKERVAGGVGQERTGRFSVPAPGWKSEWVTVRGGRMRTRELATPPSLLLFWNAVCIYCPVDPSFSQEVIFSRDRGE